MNESHIPQLPLVWGKQIFLLWIRIRIQPYHHTFRTIGDMVFDIVKEVIAETLGGLVTRGLGLGTGRSGGREFSLMGSVMRAVAKVGNGGTC